MTKEKLIEKCFHICDNKKISSDAEYLASTMRKFFESNVCIPKGENRHPYADVMHEWVEGVPCEIKMKFYWDDLTTFKELYDGDILRIKPSEPVYEWQWKFKHQNNTSSMWNGFTMYATDSEFEEIKMPWMKYEKDESTKRVQS